MLFRSLQITCSRCARTTSSSSCTERSMERCSGHRTSGILTALSPSRRTRCCSASCSASTCCSWTATITCWFTMAPTPSPRPRWVHGFQGLQFLLFWWGNYADIGICLWRMWKTRLWLRYVPHIFISEIAHLHMQIEKAKWICSAAFYAHDVLDE